MERNDTRSRDAEILASLRRRAPGEDSGSGELDGASAAQKESQARAETLRRLRTSGAPKTPMSAVSPAIRNLRGEIAPAAHSAIADVDSEATSYEAKNSAYAASRRESESVEEKKSEIMTVSRLYKSYAMGKKRAPVLRGVNLSVYKGEFLAVVGQSGSGKSTLLHLMGTLDVPDSGTIYFDGQRIDNLSIAQRDVLRNRFIGMVFQFYHLLPELSVLENVLAPLMIRESVFGYFRKKRQYVQEAKDLLNVVGLSHRLKHRPNELSGGEMQRASIARALISSPRLLLADEPTGNLDSKASVGVLELLRKLNAERELTVVMVTHDLGQARDADRAVRIIDGQVIPDG